MSEHVYLLPWRVEWYNGKAFLRDRAGAMLAEFTLGSGADAELVVLAVNERDQLRAELAAANARIEQLEAAARWIPVEERLPEDDGHYIVAVSESTSRSPIDWRDRVVYECVYSGVGWHTANDVTHWQPLPQPPQGEGG